MSEREDLMLPKGSREGRCVPRQQLTIYYTASQRCDNSARLPLVPQRHSKLSVRRARLRQGPRVETNNWHGIDPFPFSSVYRVQKVMCNLFQAQRKRGWLRGSMGGARRRASATQGSQLNSGSHCYSRNIAKQVNPNPRR